MRFMLDKVLVSISAFFLFHLENMLFEISEVAFLSYKKGVRII